MKLTITETVWHEGYGYQDRDVTYVAPFELEHIGLSDLRANRYLWDGPAWSMVQIEMSASTAPLHLKGDQPWKMRIKHPQMQTVELVATLAGWVTDCDGVIMTEWIVLQQGLVEEG